MLFLEKPTIYILLHDQCQNDSHIPQIELKKNCNKKKAKVNNAPLPSGQLDIAQ